MDWPYTGVMPHPPIPVNLFTEPTELTVGDSVMWWRSIPDKPASAGWQIVYTLRGGTGSTITFSSAADGDNHKVSLHVNDTKDWKAGTYLVQGRVVNQARTDSYPIYDGQLVIGAALTNVNASADVRSPWTIIRDNCLVVIQGRASDDVLDSTIEGTSFRRMDNASLLALYDRAQQNVQNEIASARAKAGMGTGRQIYATFTRPT